MTDAAPIAPPGIMNVPPVEPGRNVIGVYVRERGDVLAEWFARHVNLSWMQRISDERCVQRVGLASRQSTRCAAAVAAVQLRKG